LRVPLFVDDQSPEVQHSFLTVYKCPGKIKPGIAPLPKAKSIDAGGFNMLG
jgi:hypothetical protein